MTYTVSGIDVSQWQDPDGDAGRMAGCEFVGIRATYGTVPDGTYARHEANARKAGAVVLAYCFGRYGDGSRQAQALVNAAPNADLYVLDLERDGGNPSMTASQASAFFAAMLSLTGKKFGLYHSESGFPQGLGQQFNWVAKWGTVPPTIPHAFWQWQGSPLDRDWFNGTLDQLRLMAGLTAGGNEPDSGWRLIVEDGATVRHSTVGSDHRYRLPDDATPWHADTIPCHPRAQVLTTSGRSITAVFMPGGHFGGRWVHLGPKVTAKKVTA